ncbi:uncharacterized protein F5147DRAFT_610165 [Suillus discolor]|uniref:Tyrosine--tRNA ligase n=1 Tax=Suillus discolor TaxID=1912936 RepID=A0A9P7FBX8_9AGAM|nr:uncharacterized protein F5147DRAFT_610165 [Suillus discolor]KAG2111250.1 hypothetical protein F5147DRAFT_610165 [Suillus discolor]
MLKPVRRWPSTAHRIPLRWKVIPLTRNLHSGRDLLSELSARQLIADVTRPDDFAKHLQKSRTIYAGIDPTAKSLHAGHLIPLLCLLHFRMRGHNTLALIGGATGLVGDPSGRMMERSLSEKAQIESNTVKLTHSIQQFFSRATEYALDKAPSLATFSQLQVVNNIDWLKELNLLDFLRSTGIHFRVNHMLARDSVKLRMSAHNGITFTEFTYQLLQGYDFYELFRTMGCTIQVGGSDQWGNILSGIDLINKVEGDCAGYNEGCFALTTPLLTTSQGEKFGKSAGNAVWLDEKLTSYLDFYQFFLRTTDADVEKYLKMFTLLPVEEIDDVVREHGIQPERRLAQKLLAKEVTLLIHGKEGLEAARVATNVLFGTDYSTLHAKDIVKSLANDPRLVLCTEDELLGITLPNIAAKFGLASSKSAARQLALGNGLYLNNVPQPDVHLKLERSHLIDGQVAILRAGKDTHLILALR